METLWFVVADSAIKAPSEGSPGRREKLNWWRRQHQRGYV